MPDRYAVSRIELDSGSVVFRQEPPVVVVFNAIADLIFQRLSAGVPKRRIAAELRNQFGDTRLPDIDAYVDDTILSFEELIADDRTTDSIDVHAPPFPDDRDEKNAFAFDEVIMAGSAATRLQITCDHFDDLLLNIYGPAVQERADIEGPVARLQVVFADDHYWLKRGTLDTTGPLNRHGAFLEIQRYVLSTAHAPRRTDVILHASAVLDEARARSIILAGGSGSGKSSLTAAFLFRDFTFIADDTAIVDADSHELWWLDLPLRLKSGTWAHIRPKAARAFERWEMITESRGRKIWQLHPKRSAAANRRLASPCSAILFPLYDAEAPTEISKVEPLTAMALMIESGAWFETSEEAMASTIKWLSDIPCYSVIFSSADDVVSAVNALLPVDAVPAV